MEKYTLLQSFAVNIAGEIVHVRDVKRGKSCGCFCPECREPLIARKGEVRAWHFGHTTGAECCGSAESALHLAAKEVIRLERKVTTPAISKVAHHMLEDGRKGRGEAIVPEFTHNLRDIVLEQWLDAATHDNKPDVQANTDFGRLAIEIAVTHPCSVEKIAKIERDGVATLEIFINPSEHVDWNWETLRSTVISGPINRQWLFHPIENGLVAEAEHRAYKAALAQYSDERDYPTPPEPTIIKTKLRLRGVPVYLTDYKWGFSLWHPYSDEIYSVVSKIATLFGGRWKRKYRNWTFSVGVRKLVEDELRNHGASR